MDVLVPLTRERVSEFFEENEVRYNSSIMAKGMYLPDLDLVYINPIYGDHEQISTMIHEILHWHYADLGMDDSEDMVEYDMEQYIGTEIEEMVRRVMEWL